MNKHYSCTILLIMYHYFASIMHGFECLNYTHDGYTGDGICDTNMVHFMKSSMLKQFFKP